MSILVDFLRSGTAGVGLVLKSSDAPLRGKILGYHDTGKTQLYSVPPDPFEDWCLRIELAGGASVATIKCSDVAALLPPSNPPRAL